MIGPRAPNIPTPNPPESGSVTGRARPTTQDVPAKGIGFSIMASMLLTASDTISKLLSGTWPVSEIMVTRGATILVFILAVLVLRGRLHALRIQNRSAMAVRAGAICLATFLFLNALHRMPIADALSIIFISPVFATLLAVVFLKERVGWRRWTAMGVGFLGVLIALNPGNLLGDRVAPYPIEVALLPLAAALMTASRDVASRRLVSGDDSLGIMFYTVLAVVCFGFAVMPWSDPWLAPAPREIGLVLGTAVFMFGAYFLQIESFRFAPVNLVVPFRYVSLIFAAVLGFLVFGDVPAPNMALGALVIVGSGLYIWWRERKPR